MPAPGRSAPLGAYGSRVAAGMAVIGPPEVVRKPHWCVTAPPPACVSLAVPPTQVVHTLERHGGAVVIGRGAQFIVPSERALRVRVICVHEKRVSGYASRQGMSEGQARKKVDDTDRERQAFYRKHYGQEVVHPTHYDVMVNTGALSLEAAAEVIVAAYRAKFGRLPD